jgi:phosphopantothenate-cysteine ligase/phosphopantothenoylcysteine decarboxylase/phosphopantothenate--cysteine ligase
MRFLVTAGSTHEMIDTVRSWGNIFTGNTGRRIATALAGHGEVDLLTSNRQHVDALNRSPVASHRVHAQPFDTHADLRAMLEQQMTTRRYDAVFMSAAVADYKPVRTYAVVSRQTNADGTEHWIVRDVQAEKVKSNHRAIAVLGEQTEKLVDLFRKAWDYRGLLVKFKLEVGIPPQQLIEIGEASRKSSGADYLVANTLDMVEGPNAGAYLLSDAPPEWVPRAELPSRLVRVVGRM